MLIENGLLNTANLLISSYCDERPPDMPISLLVIHNISLPPGQFGGNFIDALFSGTLDPLAHPFFAKIAHLRVSAHNLIRRDGSISQYVPYHKRAWHAGVSSFQGQQACNDFAIGIELEGTDEQSYTRCQYNSLVAVSKAIMQKYPDITLGRIVGHQDIAPGRKTDPGVAFDWAWFRQALMISQGKMDDTD